MTRAEFDVELSSLVESWTPRLGPPTCAAGCSRCCERATVLITSGEALALIEAADRSERGAGETRRERWRRRAADLLDALDPEPRAEAALDALIESGPCVFLEDRRCSAYSARPSACRACFVWHQAWYCGRPEYDMCPPAELNEIRIRRAHHSMLEEFHVGRRPFWGQLLPIVDALDGFEDAYRSGDDVRDRLDPRWERGGLIAFPGVAEVERELADLERMFSEDPTPFGFPRAADAPDRGRLRPFKLD